MKARGCCTANARSAKSFVRIPQFGHGCSLNVNVAGAIVLHHFATWTGFEERPIADGKFASPAGHAFVPDHALQHGRLPPSIRRSEP